MFLTRFSLRNPVAVTLFYVLVGLLGTFAFARMGRSILPPVAFPVVAIAAPYPGAAPGEIERLVLMPIEDRLDAVPQVDRVFATAQEGLGAIQVRFRFGSNLDGDRINVQQAVDAARPNMPADLVPPAVLDADPSQAPILEASVSSAVLGPRALTEIVDNRIAPALRATAGAGTVRISGEVTPQLTIEPRTGALYELGGTPLDLLRAVQSANDIFPGGRLRSALSESTVGVRSSADTVTSLALLPVGLPGGSVRVNDVANVRDGYEDPDELVDVDGSPGIVLSVGRAPGADSLRTISAIDRTLDRLAARFPLVRFTPLRSDAPSTVQATDGVFQTIAEGVALTVLVTLFFLRVWRSALIAAIAIPTSLCAALVAMWAVGFTIDVLSLMGLSLTIGILVDDSIVILEAIESNARQGLHGDDAAVAGRNELGSAAFAITLVDVAVFAPIAFMGGVVGEFMREFGLTIVFRDLVFAARLVYADAALGGALAISQARRAPNRHPAMDAAHENCPDACHLRAPNDRDAVALGGATRRSLCAALAAGSLEPPSSDRRGSDSRLRRRARAARLGPHRYGVFTAGQRRPRVGIADLSSRNAAGTHAGTRAALCPAPARRPRCSPRRRHRWTSFQRRYRRLRR